MKIDCVIWCENIEKGVTKLNKILEDYKAINMTPVSQKRSREVNAMLFENGDYFRVIKAHLTKNRGVKGNLYYVDNNIDVDIIQKIILPSSIGRPFFGINYF